MASGKSKRDANLKDMLTRSVPAKGAAPPSARPAPPAPSGDPPPASSSDAEIVIKYFLESLFSSLWEDLKVVKHDLTLDLRDVKDDLMEVGDHVASLEDSRTSR